MQVQQRSATLLTGEESSSRSPTRTTTSVERTKELLRRASSAMHLPTNKRVPSKQRHVLSPFAKFKRYGRFPCKFVLNVVCFALLAAFAIACEGQMAQYEETQRQSLIRAVMPANYEDPRIEYVHYPRKHFGRVDEFRDFLSATTTNYYTLRSSMAAQYDYRVKNDAALAPHQNATTDDIEPLTMRVVMHGASGRLTPQGQSEHTKIAQMTPDSPYGLFGTLSASNIARLPKQYNFLWACAPRREPYDFWKDGKQRFYGPCRSKEIDNTLFDVTMRVLVTMKMRSVDHRDLMTLTATQYFWNLELDFDLQTNGLITLNLLAESTARRRADGMSPWMWVCLALAVFSFWDLILRVKAFLKIRRIKAILRAREVARQRALAETHSTTSTSSSDSCESEDRMRAERLNKWKVDLRNSMGKSWTIWAMSTDALTFIYAVDKLLGTFAYEQAAWLRYTSSCVAGAAIFGSSVLFVSYMRFFPVVYALTFSTNVAAPHLFRFLVAVLPIFTAYAFFGNIVFGTYSAEFSTFWEACTALFAAIFGDSLLQMFQDTGVAAKRWELRQLGFLFSATFIGFFIWAVLNIGTAIVLGSYTYVNETFSLYTFNIERRVAERKTRREQLDEAVEQAQLALRTIASLLEDDRIRLVVPQPAVPPPTPQVLPVISVSPEAAPADATHSLPPVPPGTPPLSGGEDACTCSSSSDSRVSKRRKKGHRRMSRIAVAPEFTTKPWVNRNVIF